MTLKYGQCWFIDCLSNGPLVRVLTVGRLWVGVARGCGNCFSLAFAVNLKLLKKNKVS